MPSKNSSRGFLLLEVAIALVLLTVLATAATDRIAQRLNQSAAETSAAWMLSIKNATSRYLDRYFFELGQAESPLALAAQGYSNWEQPSLAELKADGFLSDGFPERDTRLGVAHIQVIRQANCPGADCQMEALIYSQYPLKLRSQQSYSPQMVAYWLLASQGQGGHVKESTKGLISGTTFSYQNPPVSAMPELAVGTVALAVTVDELNNTRYLRQYDNRDPYFQGSATISGNITTQASLAVAGHLKLGAEQSINSYCNEEGLIAREQHSGLLVCRYGRWQSAGGRGGGGYSLSTVQGCMPAARNPVTQACSCAAGFTPVLVSDNGANTPEIGRLRGYLCVG